MDDPILALALEGERDVQAGKWTVPKEATSSCDPMAECAFCGGHVWTRWWIYTDLRPGRLSPVCTDCLEALR
jgi:hypothetical protein